jgi:hypothetical protein
VGFVLIPVCGAGQIVGAVVVVSVFEGDLDALAKMDWVFDVKPIVGGFATPDLWQTALFVANKHKNTENNWPAVSILGRTQSQKYCLT